MMHRLTLICFLLPLLLPSLANSSEWAVKGFVDQNLSYDDNVCMQPDGQLVDRQCQTGQQGQPGQQSRRGSFKYMIIPVITFQHKTNVSDVAASASYGTQLFTDLEGFDQDFQNYDLKSLYQTTRIDWGLEASYSATPTRNNAVQSGANFGSNSSQDTWSVSPSATYKIDAIDSLSFTPTYSETSFTGGGNGNAIGNNSGFSNNRIFSLNLAWQRLWSERYKTALTFFYNNFESERTFQPSQGILSSPSTYDSFGINIGNTYLISDNWQLDGTVGGRHTESKNLNNQGFNENQSSFGFLADIGIAYTGESFNTRLHFNRALTPSSFGQLQEQTVVDLNFSYNILETLTAHLTTSYQESSIVNGASSDNDPSLNNSGTRKNFVIEPSVKWRLAQDWTLGGSYRYRTQDGQNFGNNNNITGDADSNLFMLSINYNWQGISVSR